MMTFDSYLRYMLRVMRYALCRDRGSAKWTRTCPEKHGRKRKTHKTCDGKSQVYYVSNSNLYIIRKRK